LQSESTLGSVSQGIVCVLEYICSCIHDMHI